MTVNVVMPNMDRNYCLFNQAKVNYYVNKKENALPELENVLKTSKDEKEVVEIEIKENSFDIILIVYM